MNNELGEFLITTIDNPFNPFTQFDDWNKFDCDEGYNTWQRIDKLMPSNYLTLSIGERNSLINEAMEKIVGLFPFLYFKVFDSSSLNEPSDFLKDENSIEFKKEISKNKFLKLSEIVKKNLETSTP